MEHHDIAPPCQVPKYIEPSTYRLGEYFDACWRQRAPQFGQLSERQPFVRGDGLVIQYGQDGTLGNQEVIRFSEGFGLISSYFETVDEYAGKAIGEDWLTFQFRLSGKSLETFGSHEHITGLDSHCHTFMLPRGVDQSCWIEKGVKWRTVTLSMHLESAQRILRDLSAPLPADLGEMLRARRAAQFFFQAVPLTQGMTRAALDLVRSPFSGRLRHVYAEAKAMELMCLTLESLGHTPVQENEAPQIVLSARDISKLCEAKDRLDSALGTPISNEKLARLVGLNETKLTKGFRLAFGVTVFDYYQQRRMHRAHELLLQESASVSEAAHSLGYSHVSSFSKAFRRFFGMSPQAYRDVETNVPPYCADNLTECSGPSARQIDEAPIARR